jgi:hypothetical protein
LLEELELELLAGELGAGPQTADSPIAKNLVGLDAARASRVASHRDNGCPAQVDLARSAASACAIDLLRAAAILARNIIATAASSRTMV